MINKCVRPERIICCVNCAKRDTACSAVSLVSSFGAPLCAEFELALDKSIELVYHGEYGRDSVYPIGTAGLSRRWGISKDRIRRWVRSNKIPHEKIDGRYIFWPDAVDKWLNGIFRNASNVSPTLLERSPSAIRAVIDAQEGEDG